MTNTPCLLVDIGNTRLKWNWAPHNDGAFKQPTRAVAYKTASMAQLLSQQWGVIPAPFPALAVVNVAGKAVAQALTDWCSVQWGQAPRFVDTAAEFQGVRNGYADPAQLGADRWLAVIAAHRQNSGRHNVIISCGSAITVDTVTADGRHKAGPILPGRDMMLTALSAGTGDLADRYNAGSDKKKTRNNNTLNNDKQLSAGHAGSVTGVFVDNTRDAMGSGVNFAVAKALDAIVPDMCRALLASDDRHGVNILVTGGAASQVMALTTITEYTQEPDLVLQGLYIVNAAQVS